MPRAHLLQAVRHRPELRMDRKLDTPLQLVADRRDPYDN